MAELKARIANYRRGKHTEHLNQFIIVVEGVKEKSEAERLVGKTIRWRTSGGNVISGKITGTHGNKGSLVARFERGLPGQALGTEVAIEQD
ncbi:MAG: 50S ribosomal protein L35ae [Candidatus Micrarchaeia archaeon]